MDYDTIDKLNSYNVFSLDFLDSLSKKKTFIENYNKYQLIIAELKHAIETTHDLIDKKGYTILREVRTKKDIKSVALEENKHDIIECKKFKIQKNTKFLPHELYLIVCEYADMYNFNLTYKYINLPTAGFIHFYNDKIIHVEYPIVSTYTKEGKLISKYAINISSTSFKCITFMVSSLHIFFVLRQNNYIVYKLLNRHTNKINNIYFSTQCANFKYYLTDNYLYVIMKNEIIKICIDTNETIKMECVIHPGKHVQYFFSNNKFYTLTHNPDCDIDNCLTIVIFCLDNMIILSRHRINMKNDVISISQCDWGVGDKKMLYKEFVSSSKSDLRRILLILRQECMYINNDKLYILGYLETKKLKPKWSMFNKYDIYNNLVLVIFNLIKNTFESYFHINLSIPLHEYDIRFCSDDEIILYNKKQFLVLRKYATSFISTI